MFGKSLVSEIWNVRVSILEGLEIIFGKLSTVAVTDASILFMLEGCLVCLNDGKVKLINSIAQSRTQPYRC